MRDPKRLTMAQQVALVAKRMQEKWTGHSPKAATVVLSEDTLVVTLHGALTPAELSMMSDPEGAEKVQEYHRRLFASAEEELRKEITRITGVHIREAALEVDTTSGSVVHAFTSGTTVQVFLLAKEINAEDWNRIPSSST